MISLLPRDSQESSPAPQFKGFNSLLLCLLYGIALTTLHGHWEDHSLDYMGLFLAQYCLCFSTLYRLVIAFLPRSKRLMIPWLQSPSAVILDPPKRKSVTTSIFSPSICHEVMRPDLGLIPGSGRSPGEGNGNPLQYSCLENPMGGGSW